jgi:hypothetical protein
LEVAIDELAERIRYRCRASRQRSHPAARSAFGADPGLLRRPHTRLEGMLPVQPSLMSEKGPEPDIQPRGFNVSEVPEADMKAARLQAARHSEVGRIISILL